MKNMFPKVANSYNCHLCDKLLANRRNLRKHIESHNPSAKINCPQCNKVVKNLPGHNKFCHKIDSSVCSVCSKSLVNKEQHEKTAHNFVDPICCT